MEKVQNIAKWFLSKEEMTHKKVQKLCYYSQAWYVTLFDDGPLFEDEIQAWVHGPVIASLYSAYKNYKWNKIPRIQFNEDIFNENVLSVLNAVYDTYGHLTGDQLETLTHNEDPWIIAREGLKPWETCTNPISLEEMRKYYGKKYEETQND